MVRRRLTDYGRNVLSIVTAAILFISGMVMAFGSGARNSAWYLYDLVWFLMVMPACISILVALWKDGE